MKCNLVMESTNKPDRKLLSELRDGYGAEGLWVHKSRDKDYDPHIVVDGQTNNRVVLRIMDGEVSPSIMTDVEMTYLGPCSITVTLDKQ